MQRSNLYIILYTAALTIACGVLLALAAEGLKPKQQENIALEQKKNILGTVLELKEGDDIKGMYEKRVKSYVVNSAGEIVTEEKGSAEKVAIPSEYKKAVGERQLPVFEILNESDPTKTDYYVFPLYGFGLWNNIWGFVSLKGDLNTINGVLFDHAGETPGLGARITTKDVQVRYKDKEIFEGETLTSVTMMKGEGNDYSSDKHKVDGMSGATLTAKGVNNMVTEYLGAYQSFIKNKKAKMSAPAPVVAAPADSTMTDSSAVVNMSDSTKATN